MIAPDVGGAFGSKLNVYAEEALALTLARVTGRPVKWIEERSENYVATIHGRGVTHDCTLAGTPDGKILGLKFVEVADLGAYYQLLTPGIPELGGWVYMGPYNPEAYWFEFRGVLTNTTPTDAYRGAGRPEATYVLERLVDAYARQIGKDPAEVRRMNFHPPFDEATHVHLRPQHRLGQLRAGARPRAGAGRLPPVPQGAAVSSRQRGHPPDRHRAVHVHRDVRAGAVEHPRARCGTRQAAGTRRRSGACRPGRSSLPPGRRRTARATRPRGRRSWPTVWVSTPDDITVLHGDTQVTPLGHGHVRFAVGVRRRCRAAFRDGEDQGEGAHDRRARAGGVRGRPGVRRQRVPCEGRSGQGADDPRAGARAHGTRTICRPGPSRTWRPRRSTTRRTSRGRRARTSAWSRSTRRPAPPTSCGTWPSTTAARSSTR